MYSAIVRPNTTYIVIAWWSTRRVKVENIKGDMRKKTRLSKNNGSYDVQKSPFGLYLLVENAARGAILWSASSWARYKWMVMFGHLTILPRDYTRRQFSFEKNFLNELSTKDKWNCKDDDHLMTGTSLTTSVESRHRRSNVGWLFGPGTK